MSVFEMSQGAGKGECAVSVQVSWPQRSSTVEAEVVDGQRSSRAGGCIRAGATSSSLASRRGNLHGVARLGVQVSILSLLFYRGWFMLHNVTLWNIGDQAVSPFSARVSTSNEPKPRQPASALHLQTTTTTTSLATSRVRRRWGDVLDTSNLHSRTSKSAES
jgi:hypothetical protein